MMDTVEERMLRRRSQAGGLFADETDDTDRIALPPADDQVVSPPVGNDDDEGYNDDGKGNEDGQNTSSAADFRRFGVLRDLFGLSG
eukprot:5986724-Prymnesium_polylepis.1